MLVTIGLPVWNGELYLAQAIQSALAQTVDDFELIISDNASTDATWKICCDAATRDRRVRLSQNNKNMGATYNHLHVLSLAAGRWFKWLAHDDVMRPDFLARSLAALNAASDAVLCYSAVDVIDRFGNRLYLDDALLPKTGTDKQHQRFADVILLPHTCMGFFGLAETKILRSLILDAYDGADRAMLTELALLGRFVYVSEPLFSNRDHPGRYTRAVRSSPQSSLAWWDTTAPPSTLHYWHLWRAYHRLVSLHVKDVRQRLLCHLDLAQWLITDWQILHLAADLVGGCNPAIFELARRAKQWLFPPRQHRTMT